MGTKITRIAYSQSQQAMEAQALGRVAFDAHRIEGHIEDEDDGVYEDGHYEDEDWGTSESWDCLTFHHNERGVAATKELPVSIDSDHVAEDPQHRRVRMVIAFPETNPPQAKGMFLFHGVRFVPYP